MLGRSAGRLGVIFRLTLKVIDNPTISRLTRQVSEDDFLAGGWALRDDPPPPSPSTLLHHSAGYILQGGRANAWCLFTNAEASVFRYLVQGGRAKAWCLLRHAEAASSLLRYGGQGECLPHTRGSVSLSISFSLCLCTAETCDTAQTIASEPVIRRTV